MYLTEGEKKHGQLMLLYLLISFCLIGLFYIAGSTWTQRNVHPQPADQLNCKKKLVAIQQENIQASIFNDCWLIEIRIIRDIDPEKRDYICTMRINPIYLKTPDGLEAMFSNGYRLENHGKDIVIEYLFLDERDFHFFSQNIDKAFLGIHILEK